MKKLIINCQLEYELLNDIITKEEIIEYAQNIELLDEYANDTFQLIGVWDEETGQYDVNF